MRCIFEETKFIETACEDQRKIAASGRCVKARSPTVETRQHTGWKAVQENKGICVSLTLSTRMSQ